MLRLLLSALFLLCLLTPPLRANLGETVEQCVVRYGKPIGFSEVSAQSPFGTVAFSAANFTLVVFVVDDKEVGARVSKGDKTAFTDAELKTIMDADSSGSAWTPTPSDVPGCTKWLRNDKATVLYDKEKHLVIFTSEKMADALHAAGSGK